VELRDFESILIYFSEGEIENLQVAIEKRRCRRLVLDEECSLNPAEQPDYSLNLAEEGEVFPEVPIQHPT
jgi:hypothetical protein